MKPENELTMEFLSRSCNEAFARAAVGAFIAPMDPNLEELSDIKTAVSEAVTNCIVHAYPGGDGKITLTCRVYADRNIELTVEDHGVGIPDVTAARAPLFTTGGQDRSGMGFTIMEKFMSSLQVESALGRGTTGTMTRRLQERNR
jgi:stage II sporulation protein AB (anti-sigma F factor)